MNMGEGVIEGGGVGVGEGVGVGLGGGVGVGERVLLGFSSNAINSIFTQDVQECVGAWVVSA